MKATTNRQFGFTLIEMIVSLAIFTTVLTVSVGALLVLVGTNQQLQNEQGVMTNLSFALDSMAREIRTGTRYFCDSRDNLNDGAGGEKIFQDGGDLDADPVQDCPDGNNTDRNFHGMSFVEGGGSVTGASDTRIVYFFDGKPGSVNEGKILRRVSGEDAQSIVSSGIYITDAEFYVSGSAPLSSGVGETDQSMVTIFIEARDVNDAAAKPYRVQTTITQRTLDI